MEKSRAPLLTNSNEYSLPAIFKSDGFTADKTLEFFAAAIRNGNTRKAYAQAAVDFSRWCENQGIFAVADIKPIHVAAYIEGLELSAPSIKVKLAGIRVLFDWLVTRQAIATNPASSVRGPKHSAKKGKTIILTAEETRSLLDSIDISTATGLRDRALIALMVFSFARVGAVIKMRISDVYLQGRRTWVRLHEKGGKLHEMPCNHRLEEYLHAYLDIIETSHDHDVLFRSAKGRSGSLGFQPLSQSDVYRMIRRRALQAGIVSKIGAHTFRATGITEYLKNGGKLEIAQQMANHENSKTTSLYDRRSDLISLSEVERIII